MPVLLQLRGQGTAARRLTGQMQHLGDLGIGRHAEPWPIHRRVGQGLARVEQEAVFDEQQAVDHDRRDRVEAGIKLLRIVVLVQGRRTAIADRQAGLDFFRIGHEQAFVGVVHQRRGKARLLGYHVVTLEQPWQKLAQGAVAQAQIERTGTWIVNRIAGARF
ncbi:hypothetical protein D3C87_1279740 [compost metagenome]